MGAGTGGIWLMVSGGNTGCMSPLLLLYDFGNLNFLGLTFPIYEIRELCTLLYQESLLLM